METRSKRIWELRNKPSSLQEVADEFGITRERVRQILSDEYGITEPKGFTSRKRLAELLGCGTTRLETLESKGLLEPSSCGSRTLYNLDEAEKAALLIIGAPEPEIWITLKCEQCGKERTLYRSYVKYRINKKGQRHWFCSMLCLWRWWGLNYGFGVHPEHRRKKIRTLLRWRRHRLRKRLRRLYRRLKRSLKRHPQKAGYKHKPQEGEKECLGCGTLHTRRSNFCSFKCYDRIRALVRYYEGTHKGGSIRVKGREVPCCVCGTLVLRQNTKNLHYCDEHLKEYRSKVARRIHYGEND